MAHAPAPRTDLWLAPLRLGNFVAALRIAAEGFRAEALFVGFTYAWHILRRRLRLDRPVARGAHYEMYAGQERIGGVGVVTTMIHGGGVAWLDFAGEDAAAALRMLPFLRHRLRRRRLLVLRLPVPSLGLAGDPDVRCHGALPGAGGRSHWIYSVSAGSGRPARAERVRMTRAKRPLDIETEFHIAMRRGEPIGITGIYSTSFWPAVAWGGWGALRRRAAQADTTFWLIGETERLARAMDKKWFMLETSDGPAYRSARRMYEHYGLRLLLRIDDFFAAPSAGRPGEAYLVYGRQLAE